MKANLTRKKTTLYYTDKNKINGANPDLRGNCTGLYGDCTGLCGDCSDLCGDCTGLYGSLDDCDITENDRKKSVCISDLVK